MFRSRARLESIWNHSAIFLTGRQHALSQSPVKSVLDANNRLQYAARVKRSRKSQAAAILGRIGGIARARVLSAKRRSEIARKAIQTRWATRERYARELSRLPNNGPKDPIGI